jgi:hypothetical protein
MTKQQLTAIKNVSYLAEETAHPRFQRALIFGTIVLTVNAGYE